MGRAITLIIPITALLTLLLLVKIISTPSNLSLENLKLVLTSSSDFQNNVIIAKHNIIGSIFRRKELFDPLPNRPFSQIARSVCKSFFWLSIGKYK